MTHRDTTPHGDSSRTTEFIELFTAHQRQIYLHLLTLVPNPTDADEVFQEVNLMLWQRFDQYQSGTNFRAWAYKIAYYKALEFYRRQPQNVFAASATLLDEIAGEVERQTDLLDSQFSALTHCLSKLSDNDRELIQRRYQADYDLSKIAQSLGRPKRSIYKSIGRIRRGLLECIERTLRLEGH